jgi:alpha-L-rhamnosidase
MPDKLFKEFGLRGFAVTAALLISFNPAGNAAESNRVSIAAVGAVGDGVMLNTPVIQKAIDQLATNGGGTLVIPQGEFLSGAIFLKPGVNLHLDKGAVLRGSTNIEDYPAMETRIEGHTQVWRPALVNAKKADRLRITGEGTIQGGGKPFWDAFWERRAANKLTQNVDVERPRNLFIQDSKDVQISGISLRDSGLWNLHLYRCQNVVVEKLDIRAPFHSPSTDGIDVDSCQDVTIRGCYISVNDDNIALKGDKGPSAMEDKESPPVTHIRISDCTFGLGNAGLTLGSEASVVRDVVMENCRLVGTERNWVLKLKLRPDTPQIYENITARNITVDNPAAKLVSIEGWNQFFDLHGRPPPSQSVDHVTLANITGTLNDFGRIDGPAKSTVQNVTLENIDIKLNNPEVVIKQVKNLKLNNVKINGVAYTGDQETSGKLQGKEP